LDSKEHKDVVALYDLFFQFQENVDKRFEDWGCEQETMASRLSRRGQEVANLKGGLLDLMKEVDALKARLEEKDVAIQELFGLVETLTNKRYRCNDDKVSPAVDLHI